MGAAIFVVTSHTHVLNIKVVLSVRSIPPVALRLQLSKSFHSCQFILICTLLFGHPSYYHYVLYYHTVLY